MDVPARRVAVFALLVALLRRRLRRELQARRQDYASECVRLEERVGLLAEVLTTVRFVVVLELSALEAELSPPQRLALELQVGKVRQEVLELELELELELLLRLH